MPDNVIADLDTAILSATEKERPACRCGKCGKQAEIVCFVDDVPWCEECLSNALGDDNT